MKKESVPFAVQLSSVLVALSVKFGGAANDENADSIVSNKKPARNADCNLLLASCVYNFNATAAFLFTRLQYFRKDEIIKTVFS